MKGTHLYAHNRALWLRIQTPLNRANVHTRTALPRGTHSDLIMIRSSTLQHGITAQQQLPSSSHNCNFSSPALGNSMIRPRNGRIILVNVRLSRFNHARAHAIIADNARRFGIRPETRQHPLFKIF